MVFGGLSNRVTSNVHRGRRTHSPPLPSDSSKWALAAPRLLCFSIPWAHTGVLSGCGATTYLHAALHCPRSQTSAVTHHHTCRFGVYTPCARLWHNSGRSTGCASEKHLFRLLVDEQIVGAKKRGLRQWCLKHQGLRKQQLSKISQSFQLSVDGLGAAATSTGTSRKYFSADIRYFQFCQVHACNPLPGDDFLLCVILLPSCSELFSPDLSMSTCRPSANFMLKLALPTRLAQ